MSAQAERGVPLCTLCPKFLHTNSTSHTWPFSAIAELIDNAFDPDVSAKHFWIDKTVVQEQDCLIFMDSGNGLNRETMHKMLSFGYSDKVAIKGVKPIGMYGNGFKSGSMRLGRDAIVFSKSKTTSCVGMLSQTYLEAIGAKQVVVPIVCFKQNGTEISVSDEQQASLKDILTYSPYKTLEELLVEITMIGSDWSMSKTGTRIIIWNLRQTSARRSEFDFETDRYDIRIPSDFYDAQNETDPQPGRIASHVPESFYSLRAYCSILYLKPRMQIIIRSQKVKSVLIAKSLAFVRRDSYKPLFLNKPIPITFGYNTKSKEQYGVMMYHKNRLIKAYERVGCQLKANNKGVGVIGIIECGNFLEPTHNKQSFNETDKYRKTMNNLGIKLEEYWQEIRHKKQREDPNNNIPIEDAQKRPDQNWVQCNDCSRWRKLPDGIDPSKLPEAWFCRLNPDPQFRSCNVEEEPEDSDDEQPTYRKTYKQHERAVKQNQERKKRKEEEERKRQEAQRLAYLAEQNQVLEQQKKVLELQLKEKVVHSPSYSSTQRTPRGGAASVNSLSLRNSTVSRAACSSPSVSGLPVITSVCSLSAGHQRRRSAPSSPLTTTTTPKRPRVNGIQTRQPDTSSTPDVGPQSSPSAPSLDDGGEDSDETDDDIFILEIGSTPKPKKREGFDLTKVKTEKEQSEADINTVLECNDDAALDDAMETNDAGTSSVAVGASPSPAPLHANITTQTDVPKVKEEEASQKQTNEKESAGESSSKDQVENVKVSICSTEMNQVVNGDGAGPSCADTSSKESPVHFPNITEVQEQQDQLLELMQTTAQERDSFKDQVHYLTCELKDAQDRLQELTQVTVKKESSHQAVQTEDREEESNYKNLFEKAKQKVDELIRDKESLLTAAETKPSTAHNQEQDLNEIAVHVDNLIRELDQKNKERDEMLSRLDTLEEERANLASQCEELRMSLQQQRDKAQERSRPPCRASGSSAQTEQEDQGPSNTRTDASRSLIELRHNVGRLLLTYVPALDLGQVNYECNVIDEILEQVLCDMDPRLISPKTNKNQA